MGGNTCGGLGWSLDKSLEAEGGHPVQLVRIRESYARHRERYPPSALSLPSTPRPRDH